MLLLNLHKVETRRPTAPLLSPESLNRLAWSVYFFDATVSGGVFGQTSLEAEALQIQLPTDENSFLRHTPTVTESLMPPPTTSSDLGIDAHLIRAMYARQLVAGFHSRIQSGRFPEEKISEAYGQLLANTDRLFNSLPIHMAYSKGQFLVYKEQTPLFVVLHVLRIDLQRHLAHLNLTLTNMAFQVPSMSSSYRAEMILGAKQLSMIFDDAIEWSIALDPQLAMHAYHAIESELI